MGVNGRETTMRLTLTQRERSRQLRATMTDAERKLWHGLRLRQLDGLRFRRQFAIGRYIVDFACLEARIVVELDGGQHVGQHNHDRSRDAWLRERGFRVVRVWNNEAMSNVDGVADAILTIAKHPILSFPHRGEGTC